MKQASLLITLCALLCLSASAQTTTIEKNDKRISITTTKTDENGKTVTETWVAEGDQPEKILQTMAINPDVLQKMNSDDQVKKENEERLFLFRSAGDKAAIEGKLSNGSGDSKGNGEFIEKIIIISNNKNDVSPKPYAYYHGGSASADVWVRGTGDGQKSNCAALGVYVNTESDLSGTKISALIEKGGAKEAGMLAGDVINKIDQYEVTDFPSLHDALSHYVAGDVVTVRYTRNDKNQKAKVELRDWAQLPGHEWRARTDCGKPASEDAIDEISKGPVDGQLSAPAVQSLQLDNASVFPNPTEGVFSLSFQTTPGPLTVSITDVNGKVVYNENNDNSSGSYKQEINLKGMPQGNYILSVNQGGKIYSQQISKQ
ncbi:MAG: PDZ domain-containing protein [Saprospiraceae bacterium]